MHYPSSQPALNVTGRLLLTVITIALFILPAAGIPTITSMKAAGASVIDIATSLQLTCLLTSDGGVQCWGRTADGTIRRSPFLFLASGSGVQDIMAGRLHNCAIYNGGGAKCWGMNRWGQLGTGNTTYYYSPVDVVGLTSGVSAMAGGYYHTCAIVNSAVKCWGTNPSGQVGDGTTGINRFTPVDVVGLNGSVTAITAGYYHTCAIVDGNVKCWGDNSYGQLGDGTTTPRPLPVSVVTLETNVIAITAGEYHTCALTIDGTVKCWGFNLHGQLGDGTLVSQSNPISVNSLESGVAAITAGENHSCAKTSTGSVKCWGYNVHGQLGDGSTVTQTVPIDVVSLTNNVSILEAGGYHNCVLTTESAVKCWGFNYYGQIGDGTGTSRYTPADVIGFAGTEPTSTSTVASNTPTSVATATRTSTSTSIPTSPTIAPSTTSSPTPVQHSQYGFRPYPYGYSFSNFDDLAKQDFTAADMVRIFGESKVCAKGTGLSCQLNPCAAAWLDYFQNKLLPYGRCVGMSVLSLSTYRDKGLSAATYFLSKADARRDIALQAVKQYSTPINKVINYNRKRDPNAVLSDLQNAMQSGNEVVLNMWYTRIDFDYLKLRVSNGHAVVPYAINDQGNGIFWVYVYDSNHPGDDNRYISIDTNNHIWEYNTGEVLGLPLVWKGGLSSDFHPDSALGIVPISYFDPGVNLGLLSCDEPVTTLAQDTVSQLETVIVDGDNEVLFTDPQGRRFGYVDGDFVSEIPGAYAEGTLTLMSSIVFHVPSPFSLIITGAASTAATEQGSSTTVTKIGTGHAVSISGLTVRPREQSILSISDNGQNVNYSSSHSDTVTITAGLDLDPNNNSGWVSLENFPITANGSLGIQIGNQLVVDASSAGFGEYDLRLERITNTGTITFNGRKIPLNPGDVHTIGYNEWGQSDNTLPLWIDNPNAGRRTGEIINGSEPTFQKALFLPFIRR